jgi:hypothetical protein
MIMDTMFPDLIKILGDVPVRGLKKGVDPADALAARLFAAIFYRKSMRDWTDEDASGPLGRGIAKILGLGVDGLPRWRDVSEAMSSIDPDDLSDAVRKLNNCLREAGFFKLSEARGFSEVCIDGVSLWSSQNRMSPYDLTRIHRDSRGAVKSVDFHVGALEAKLVGAGGSAISLATVFIENDGPDPHVDAQLEESRRTAALQLGEEMSRELDGRAPRGGAGEAAPDTGAPEGALDKAKAEKKKLAAQAREARIEWRARKAELKAAEGEAKARKKASEAANAALKGAKGPEARRAAQAAADLAKERRVASRASRDAAADAAESARQACKTLEWLRGEAAAKAAAAKEEEARGGKQACELKALGRLLDKLAAAYPELRMHILLDSLFACGPAIDELESRGLGCAIRVKSGRAPSVGRAAKEALPGGFSAEGADWAFVRDLVLQGHRVSLAYRKEPGHFAFIHITSERIDGREACMEAVARGRRRWRIENEGFNAQKRLGFHLCHQFSKSHEGRKCHYFMIQMAHTISQTLDGCSLEVGVKRWGLARWHAEIERRIAALGAQAEEAPAA